MTTKVAEHELLQSNVREVSLFFEYNPILEYPEYICLGIHRFSYAGVRSLEK